MIHGASRVIEHRLPPSWMAPVQHLSPPPGSSLQPFPPHLLQLLAQQASPPPLRIPCDSSHTKEVGALDVEGVDVADFGTESMRDEFMR